MNTSLIAIAVVSVLVTAVLGYILGRKKTASPMLTALLGALLGIAQPLGLLFLVVLATRHDVRNTARI